MPTNAANIVLQNRATFKPIEFGELGANLRQKRAQEFAQAEKRRDEQIALQDQLAQAAAKGLPKYMQGEISSKASDLIKQAQEGKIDPTGLDFRMQVAEINGLSNTYEQQVKETLTFLAKPDLQVFSKDAAGNPIDLRPQIQKSLMSLYDTDYDGKTSAMEAYIPQFTQARSRATQKLVLDPKSVEATQKAYMDKYGQQAIATSPSETPGYINKVTTTSLTPETSANWSDVWKTQNYAQDASDYMTLYPNQEIPFEQFQTQRAETYRPARLTKSDLIESKQYEAEQAMARAKVRTKPTAKYEVTAKTITPQEAVLKLEIPRGKSVVVDGEEREETEVEYKQRQTLNRDFVKDALSNLKTQSLKQHIINRVDGEDVPTREIGGIKGKPLEVFEGANNKGVILMSVATETPSRVEYELRKDGSKVIRKGSETTKGATRYELKTVPTDDVKGFLKAYNQTPAEQEIEEDVDPLNLGF
jgi:hypothetical protein